METFFQVEFPCWRYHAQHQARIFYNAASLAEAGDGWVDSPALIVAPEPVVVAEPVADPVVEAVEATEAPAVTEEAHVHEDGFDDLGKAELQARCADRGIEYDGRWSRTTLIAKLRGEE